jgi:hypothetical protein
MTPGGEPIPMDEGEQLEIGEPFGPEDSATADEDAAILPETDSEDIIGPVKRTPAEIEAMIQDNIRTRLQSQSNDAGSGGRSFGW